MRFEKERETKGAVRYQEVSDSPAVGTLYIRKDHLKELGLDGAEVIEVEIKKGEK